MIAKHYSKLNAEEAMLAGLLSVLGRLYIFMKSIEYPDITYSELDEILREWHPAIAKAIAEVLIAARMIYQHELAGEPLDGTLFPILQRLGICSAEDDNASLEEHQAQIDSIRNALMK